MVQWAEPVLDLCTVLETSPYSLSRGDLGSDYLVVL